MKLFCEDSRVNTSPKSLKRALTQSSTKMDHIKITLLSTASFLSYAKVNTISELTTATASPQAKRKATSTHFREQSPWKRGLDNQMSIEGMLVSQFSPLSSRNLL